jgi:predicted HTH transcriptional regulator
VSECDPDHLNLDHVATFSQNAGMGPLDAMRTDHELRRLGLYSPLQPAQLHKAAVLCFATRPDVFLPQARSILVIGNRAERGFQRMDVTGPLPDQYRTLIDHVEGALARQGLRRDRTSQLFFDAVREAISNAIAHRDYTRNGAVRVTVQYPSVEVVSPGGFPSGRTWRSVMQSEHVSNPVDAAIAWYLTTVLAFEGVGRGFEIFEEYVRTTSDSHWCAMSSRTRACGCASRATMQVSRR